VEAPADQPPPLGQPGAGRPNGGGAPGAADEALAPSDDPVLAKALLSRDPDAWERFAREHRPRLEAHANRLVRSGLGRRGQQDGGDLVSELVRKMLAQPALLEPIAAGERSLAGTLHTALRNLAIDAGRRQPMRTLPLEEGQALAPMRSNEAVGPPRSLEGCCRALTLLLRAHGAELRPVHRAASLLDARLWVARCVRAVWPSRADAGVPVGVGGTPVSARVATWLPWSPDEAGLVLTAGGPLLVGAWAQLCPLVDDAAATLNDLAVAAVIGVSAAALYKWRQRAREALWRAAAAEWEAVLPEWFSEELRGRVSRSDR
jgi:DNA-directed RNA polymerase specialized sigma24 family protein